MRSLRYLAAGSFAVALTAAVAVASGMFPGLPIVGGASYCTSFLMNPTTGAATTTCNGPRVPAGPTIITGNELIPADTQLSQGRSPQTVLLSMASINALPYQLATGATHTLTMANTTGTLILSHSTTITSAAITAAPAPVDGQRFRVVADNTVTTFSFVANTGQTLAATTPTVLTASTTVPQGYEWIYVTSTAKWYRVQ